MSCQGLSLVTVAAAGVDRSTEAATVAVDRAPGVVGSVEERLEGIRFLTQEELTYILPADRHRRTMAS